MRKVMQRVPRMTESSLPGPSKNMLAVASNGLLITCTSREAVICHLH
jgi:hypothetical protein